MGDINNYVKIHEAVQAFCEWSLPSIEFCIRQWHKNQQGTLPQCCKPPSTCPSYKNPNAKKSNACQSCRQWGTAVEGECHPPGRDVQWKNVDATVLYKDPVEVAKGFVFILPQARLCSSFNDFDVGGILKIMIGFKGYHNGDKVCVDMVQKVVDIRNNLAHMKVRQKMQIPDAETSTYFLNIKALVTDLQARHACLKSSTATIISVLDKIQSSGVTEDQIQRATKPLTDGLQQSLVQSLQQQTQDLKQCIEKHHNDTRKLITFGNTTGSKALQQQTGELQRQLNELSQDVRLVTEQQTQYIEQLIKDGNTEGAEALQKQTKELQHQLEKLSQDVRLVAEQQTQYIEQLIKDGNSDIKKVIEEVVSKFELKQTNYREDFDLASVKQQLIEEYLETRGKLPLLPGMPEEFARMEDLFVDLHIVEEQKKPTGVILKELKSHGDIVCIEQEIQKGNKKAKRVIKRVLVKGKPGVGKSSAVSKLAYDWACGNQDSPVSNCCLQSILMRYTPTLI